MSRLFANLNVTPDTFEGLRVEDSASRTIRNGSILIPRLPSRRIAAGTSRRTKFVEENLPAVAGVTLYCGPGKSRPILPDHRARSDAGHVVRRLFGRVDLFALYALRHWQAHVRQTKAP